MERLKYQAVQPQATVMLTDTVSSSASVQGDIKPRPDPVIKPDQHDVLAMADGPDPTATRRSAALVTPCW